MRRRLEERVWKEARLDGLSLLRATYLEHRFAVHAQETFVIAANVRGFASCFDRTDLVVSPDCLVVVPPGEAHGGHRVGQDPWVYRAIYPTSEFLRGLLQDVIGSSAARPGFARLVYPDRELARRFVHAHRALLSGTEVLRGEAAMLGFLACLLERYSVGRPAPSRPGHEPRPVARAVEFIHDHLASPLSLAELAQVAGFSRFHFLRVFAHETGQTPHEYVMQRRVERAKELLRRGKPIADVAYSAGFADQAHLSRRFKRLVGVTPGEFVRGRPT